MKLIHKIPCRDCPWRKDSLQGYLGGYKPEPFADSLQLNHALNCHKHTAAFCVGSLATLNNSCIEARTPHGAAEAADIIGKRDDCFEEPADFYLYHAGGPYRPLFERQRAIIEHIKKEIDNA